MVTVHKNRIDDIEVLRAFAILFTVVGHVKALLYWGNSSLSTIDKLFGLWTGVDLFFAISGFVIARDLLQRLQTTQPGEKFWRVAFAFWIRRIYRIWPTSWLWVLVPVALGLAFGRLRDFLFLSQSLSDFSAVMMQVANFHFWYCQSNHLWSECGIAYPWWSLSLEEQFYLVLPLFFLVFRKNLSYVLIAVVLGQVFIPRPVWSFMWVIRTDAICLGVLIAIMSRGPIYRIIEPRFLNNRLLSFAFLGLLLFLLANLPSNWDGKINPVPFSTGMVAIVSAVLVLVASYDGNYFARGGFVKHIFLWIGTRSFALYLIHEVSMSMTILIWRHIEPTGTVFGANYTLRFLATWLVLLPCLAELNYRFIEVPLRRKGRIIAEAMATEA